MAIYVALKTGNIVTLGKGRRVEQEGFPLNKTEAPYETDGIVCKDANEEVIGRFKSSDIQGWYIE